MLLVRVQSHPSRRELRERLVSKLDECEIVETDFTPPNPWLGYRECLTDLPTEGHVLIVQDDAVTCLNVIPAVHRIIEREPAFPICLYMGLHTMASKRQALIAGKAGDHFVEIHRSGFMPLVATLWPVDKAVDFKAWVDEQKPRSNRGRVIVEASDDGLAGHWRRSRRVRVFATIPSLFEHLDDVPSTIARKPGGRTAIFWHGEEWDALSVEW